MNLTVTVQGKVGHTDWDLRPVVRLDCNGNTHLYVPKHSPLARLSNGAELKVQFGPNIQKTPFVAHRETQLGWPDGNGDKTPMVRIDISVAGKRGFKRGALHFYVPVGHPLAAAKAGDGISITA